MADSTKVRLVRCPKCDNLLPELADYSVYQCGGCGAVLRAKVKRKEGDNLSEKSDEERFIGVSVKSDNSLEKKAVDPSEAFDSGVNTITGSMRCEQRDFDFEKDVSTVQKFSDEATVIAENWIVENGSDNNTNRDEQNNLVGRRHRDLNSRVDSTRANHHSETMPDWRVGGKGIMEELHGIPRSDAEVMRFSALNHQDEGQSNFQMGSKYGLEESMKKYNDHDGVNRVQYLEKDRAELLKKLDGLRDQLTRSCNVSDKPSNEKLSPDGRFIPPEPYGGSDACTQDGSLGSNKDPTTQFLRPDKYVVGAPHLNYYEESLAYNNSRKRPVHGYLRSMPNPNHISDYEESLATQMRSGGPHGYPRHYQQRSSHPYFSQQYADVDSNSFEPYPRDAMYHQPSCSCFHCYDHHRRVSAPIPSAAFYDKSFSDFPSHPVYYHYEDRPPVVGPHVPNLPRASMCSKHVLQPHTRWPSDVNCEMPYVRSHPKRVNVASSLHHCHPICGGAPFLTCSNCLETLQLPKKAVRKVKNQQKILCGACYTVINFSVVDKKIILSVNGENIQTPMPIITGFSEMGKDSTAQTHGHAKHTYAEFSFNDYDNYAYDLQSIDREPVLISTGIGLNDNKHQEMQSFHSSSPFTSEEENSPEIPVDARDGSTVHQRPIKTSLSPSSAGSPLEKHFDYTSNNHAVNRFGKGNRSSRSDQEKVKPNKIASRQNSLKEASLATEMEVSFNEYSNTGISQDSGDTSKEEDRSKKNKGGESFFAKIKKKSFKDISRSNQTDERSRSTVSVNGHPIPDRVLKKAEKLAGPIQPGEYWYDCRAGFWGVIGGPCLGIIPPFIEEFNYPIPENCAAGNTTVFVNGRELHQKDLDLLAGRGLPGDKNRSYIIEISGRVLDEDTGEELDSLGKLAPTVEKVKHGFGMKAPRTTN